MRPGADARTESALDDTPLPPPGSGPNVTLALTSSFVAGAPAFATRAESAIEKQLACAAARSSSGLVAPSAPVPSVRSFHDVAACRSAPLLSDTVPLPVCRSPCQVAFAS